MKLRQVVLSLIALVTLGIAFGVGRYFQLQTGPLNIHDHQITVYAYNGACEVTSPVVPAHFGTDRVQWLSDDNQYTIDFINIDPPSSSTFPPLPSGYAKETPLVPGDNQVTIDKNNPSRYYNLKHQTKYYYYAIYDHSHNLCKVSTDDHDTGLNVKP